MRLGRWLNFPAAATADDDLEYYIRIKPLRSETIYFPVTAPALNQTLIAMPSSEPIPL